MSATPKCPLYLTLIGWLFIAAGVVGVAYHATELDVRHPFVDDALWILAVRLLAIAGGALLLRGWQPARWVLSAWLVYHVIIGALHSFLQSALHGLLAAGIIYLLFRPAASAYFQQGKSHSAAGK